MSNVDDQPTIIPVGKIARQTFELADLKSAEVVE
jgi:hypothetical protein